MEYLFDLGFSLEEINKIKSNSDKSTITKLEFFSRLVKENYNYLKSYGISNIKVCFINHIKMFFMNPDRFRSIFNKYDRADLVRCIEKNDAVLEKL
ncbi:MAG: hypothetical protein IJD92_00415 [Bacilli bacterium]|nr:hypothetical protein [Bacilli bacterium]